MTEFLIVVSIPVFIIIVGHLVPYNPRREP
jgi:hypothetical protein